MVNPEGTRVGNKLGVYDCEVKSIKIGNAYRRKMGVTKEQVHFYQVDIVRA